MGKDTRRTTQSRPRPLYQRTQIRAWREYKEMSQEELADGVGEYLMERGITEKGYSHASIGRIETGKMAYSQPIMEAISHVLGVPVQDLIATPPPAPGEEPPPDTADLIRFWKEFSKIGRRS